MKAAAASLQSVVIASLGARRVLENVSNVHTLPSHASSILVQSKHTSMQAELIKISRSATVLSR